MEATLREKLYLTISKFSIRSLFYDYFMFFDTTPYLADQLFIRHEVRVWFDSEYAKELAKKLSDKYNTSVMPINCESATSEKRTFRSSLQLSKISKKA